MIAGLRRATATSVSPTIAHGARRPAGLARARAPRRVSGVRPSRPEGDRRPGRWGRRPAGLGHQVAPAVDVGSPARTHHVAGLERASAVAAGLSGSTAADPGAARTRAGDVVAEHHADRSRGSTCRCPRAGGPRRTRRRTGTARPVAGGAGRAGEDADEPAVGIEQRRRRWSSGVGPDPGVEQPGDRAAPPSTVSKLRSWITLDADPAAVAPCPRRRATTTSPTAGSSNRAELGQLGADALDREQREVGRGVGCRSPGPASSRPSLVHTSTVGRAAEEVGAGDAPARTCSTTPEPTGLRRAAASLVRTVTTLERGAVPTRSATA